MGCTACALTSKSPPIEIRYFAPSPAVSAATVPTSARAATKAPPLLCLRRITASEFLRDAVVYRLSSYEVRTYENLRWTEYPADYLQRSVARTLFDSGRFVQDRASPSCPSLDIDLLGFEEVRRDDTRAGRVQLAYRVHDGPQVIASDLVTVEVVAKAGGGADAIVAAISAALEQATARLAIVLARALSRT
jgi:uncharacterized lipoprotein YmbA